MRCRPLPGLGTVFQRVKGWFPGLVAISLSLCHGRSKMCYKRQLCLLQPRSVRSRFSRVASPSQRVFSQPHSIRSRFHAVSLSSRRRARRSPRGSLLTVRFTAQPPGHTPLVLQQKVQVVRCATTFGATEAIPPRLVASRRLFPWSGNDSLYTCLKEADTG